MPSPRRTVVSSEDSDVHDEPHIKGQRITVQHIHTRVEEYGLRPRTVADRLGLSLSDVYHALAYYHDHPEEMQTVEEHREKVRRDAESNPDIATGLEDAPLNPE